MSTAPFDVVEYLDSPDMIRAFLAEKDAEIEKLREAARMLWVVLRSNGGYTLESSDLEGYPGDDRAIVAKIEHLDGTVSVAASVRDEQRNDT